MSGIPKRRGPTDDATDTAEAVEDIAYFAKKIAKSRLRLETQLTAGLTDAHPTVKTERGIAEREMSRLRLMLESFAVAGDLPPEDGLISRFASACHDSEDKALSVLAVSAIMEAANSAEPGS